MLHYPDINPIALQWGPIKVHWYGIMYLLAFLIAWALLCWRAKYQKHQQNQWNTQQISDLILYSALGVLIGGRLGYMIFYDLGGWIRHPLSVFEIWDGGMSFHGGLLGVLVSTGLFVHKVKKSVWEVTDFIVPVVPIGLGLGRIGNFINGELWGRVTQVPWGMVFPRAGDLPRHPSQLYEFALEGLVLFIILWWFSSKPRPRFAVSALFLFGYGCARFFCEFFRQPDPQCGFIALGWLTMGQILSLPMILIGGYALVKIFIYQKISCSTH